MPTCECRCGCENEFKRNASTEYAVFFATGQVHKQTLCDYCLKNDHKNREFQTYDNDDPLTILKQRLARGEISIREFEDLKYSLERS